MQCVILSRRLKFKQHRRRRKGQAQAERKRHERDHSHSVDFRRRRRSDVCDRRPRQRLDHAAFRRNRPNADKVIGSNSLGRVRREKSVSAFSQRALDIGATQSAVIAIKDDACPSRDTRRATSARYAAAPRFGALARGRGFRRIHGDAAGGSTQSRPPRRPTIRDFCKLRYVGGETRQPHFASHAHNAQSRDVIPHKSREGAGSCIFLNGASAPVRPLDSRVHERKILLSNDANHFSSLPFTRLLRLEIRGLRAPAISPPQFRRK